jgi:hypothetical protein
MIKLSLEKELPQTTIESIKGTVKIITSSWNWVLKNAHRKLDFLEEYEYDFEKTADLFPLQPELEELREINKDVEYRHPPIEMLYLKIVQHEYRGQIEDIFFAQYTQMPPETDYNVPPEFINRMRELVNNKISITGIDTYLNEHAPKIAQLTYLKLETSTEERRRIRKSSEKLHTQMARLP